MACSPSPDHPAINNSIKSAGGQILAGIINKRTTDFINEGHSELDDILLQALPISTDAWFDSRKREHEPSCFPKTRTDLLNEIQNWFDGESPQSIFWLNGLAGTGKSTIAQTVAATCSTKKTLGASFFFSRGGEDVGHAEKFVTTIAFQLAKFIPDLKRKICDSISTRSDIATQSLRDQWQDLVLSPLSNLGDNHDRSRYALIIDALDECENQNDIQIIQQLLSQVRSLKVVQLRVFLTSGPEVPIRYGFEQIHEDEHEDFVLHNISPSIVDHDIYTFLRERLGSIGQKYQFQADWPDESAITSLVPELRQAGYSKDKNGRTQLSWAAEKGHEDTVRQLLHTGKVDADSKDKNGRTPLLWAAEQGHEAIDAHNEVITELLLVAGASFKSALGTAGSAGAKDFLIQSALYYAAAAGDEEMAKVLVSAGANVNKVSRRDLKAPLHLAAESGQIGVVTVLLDENADPTMEDQLSRSPLYYASRAGEHV
ncbi:hypothetical protein BP5796_12235 [Coleophoma crateriformis]|uniref:Nephrocystin 3-like N-terminal domain-containing protein n=1 Tax=Coleophoma crateriformis TaxID=565419 RepID=A0A3D8Q8Z9_9HELO|nr:hypothetical protein BP5796_12235 [Coleophoma crateriformis]